MYTIYKIFTCFEFQQTGRVTQIYSVDYVISDISEKFRKRSYLKSDPSVHSGENASLEFPFLRHPTPPIKYRLYDSRVFS
jgi:hypothetical protein